VGLPTTRMGMPGKRRTKAPALDRVSVPAASAGSLENSGPQSGSKTAGPRDGRLPVVGIGASAGGLEAFEKFFTAMPADSGLAFVLVTHLDAHQRSSMHELVQR